MAHLPNKKIIFIFSFILLIFAGWFFFFAQKNKQSEYIASKENNILSVADDKTSQYDADTDGDGLKDWEEALWKTDINKADTDGDGTNDNEEIATGRDPLKAGPNDKISDKEDLVAQEKAVADSKQNTMTAIYARKFMAEYLTLKTEKGDLTEEDKQNLVVKTMNDIKPPEVEDKYKISDLKIVQDDSKESIKNYADEMKKILIDDSHTFLNSDSAFKVLLKKLKEKEGDYSDELEVINYSSGLYNWLSAQLITFAVPSALANEHIKAVNGFYNTAVGLYYMTFAPSDPVKAMAGLKLQEEQIKIAYDAVKNIQLFFDKYGIFVF